MCDDTLLVLLNAHHDAVDFKLPGDAGDRWEVLLHTDCNGAGSDAFAAGGSVRMQHRSLALLRQLPQ
jgi:pullulanase/glycogen debranching enzyme